ncbi:hypothetical protein H0N98_05355 [Candidatus Micrarchaeota archaeon]|nr:hypothetical protein [Candidatus Micrarchaeota archaeon]
MSYTVTEALKEMLAALMTGEISQLKKISDRCISEFALGEKSDLLDVAIVSYVLAKVLEKPRYWNRKIKKEFVEKVQESLHNAVASLDENRLEDMREYLKSISEDLKAFDTEDRRYVGSLFHKARLRFASYLYAQGFSLSNAIALTGTSKSDVLNYSGQTLMHDRMGKTKPILERLKNVRKLFK